MLRTTAMNIKVIRRENLRTLAKLAGGITHLADKLNKTQSQISHLIGKKPIKNIGDKIAAEAEVAFNKPLGWLDHPHRSSEEKFSPYLIEQNGQPGILCSQIPLISWEEVRQWHQIAYRYKPKSDESMISTTANVGPFAFALPVHGDSMESPTGTSFSEGSIIIADPDAAATLDSFVVVRISSDRGATLKQLITQGNKRYLKPLNRRYPILELTPGAIILGVVKQMVINFSSLSNSLSLLSFNSHKKMTAELA
jgi:SOS-response transcriptional repressor LexA